jgi:hypothetical protein
LQGLTQDLPTYLTFGKKVGDFVWGGGGGGVLFFILNLFIRANILFQLSPIGLCHVAYYLQKPPKKYPKNIVQIFVDNFSGSHREPAKRDDVVDWSFMRFFIT